MHLTSFWLWLSRLSICWSILTGCGFPCHVRRTTASQRCHDGYLRCWWRNHQSSGGFVSMLVTPVSLFIHACNIWVSYHGIDTTACAWFDAGYLQRWWSSHTIFGLFINILMWVDGCHPRPISGNHHHCDLFVGVSEAYVYLRVLP